MYCKYCGIRLSGNQTVLCSVCEALKDDMGKHSEEFCYSREEIADARKRKPFVRRFTVSMFVAAVLSYGASFAFDLISSTM